MKNLIAVVLLLSATSLVIQAQERNRGSRDSRRTEQLILQLEKEGREAALNNDVEANDRLLADNWMNTNANGTVTTKEQLLTLLKNSPFKFQSIENDDVMVRVYGDSAVVTGRSTSKRIGADQEVITSQLRFTRVYAKLGNRWQIVSAQSTPIKTS